MFKAYLTDFLPAYWIDFAPSLVALVALSVSIGAAALVLMNLYREYTRAAVRLRMYPRIHSGLRAEQDQYVRSLLASLDGNQTVGMKDFGASFDLFLFDRKFHDHIDVVIETKLRASTPNFDSGKYEALVREATVDRAELSEHFVDKVLHEYQLFDDPDVRLVKPGAKHFLHKKADEYVDTIIRNAGMVQKDALLH